MDSLLHSHKIIVIMYRNNFVDTVDVIYLFVLCLKLYFCFLSKGPLMFQHR